MPLRWLSNDAGWSPHLYERWFRWNPHQAALRRREEVAVRSVLDTGGIAAHSALEMGCGTGHYTLQLARRCARVHATDPSHSMLHYLRRRLERRRIDNVTLGTARLPDLVVKERFDLVVSVGVLNYIPDLTHSLQALAGTLAPGGSAVFTVPLQTFGGRLYRAGELLSRHRAWLRTPDDVERAAADAGFRVIATQRAGFTSSGLTYAVHGVLDAAPAC